MTESQLSLPVQWKETAGRKIYEKNRWAVIKTPSLLMQPGGWVEVYGVTVERIFEFEVKKSRMDGNSGDVVWKSYTYQYHRPHPFHRTVFTDTGLSMVF